MKRIYFTLALLAAIGTGASAQLADLSSFVDMADNTALYAGDSFQTNPSLGDIHQPYGIWGVVNNGPDQIDSGSTVWVLTPANSFTTVDSGLPSDSTMGISGYYAPRDAAADSVVLAFSYLHVDSINTLLNIDSFENGSSRYFVVIMVPRQHLVEGNTYGFFMDVYGTGDDPQSTDNTDTVHDNNMAYVSVIWHGNAVGIQEMLNETAHTITIFPNPAQNVLNFKYGFVSATKTSTVNVVDMSGRVVLSKELGSHSFGTQQFNLDVSSLPEGNYLLKLSTDYVSAVSKFTIKR
jgi:hypothetical protein